MYIFENLIFNIIMQRNLIAVVRSISNRNNWSKKK